MKLSVYVLNRDVAVLEPLGDFKSVLSYHANTAQEDFVSLTMRVRTQSYEWDAPLHPIFQMNLPEGYLLQVLQEQFGPQIGASPTALLSIVGRNMVGRIKVAAPGANLNEPPQLLEVKDLLRGDNSEEAFAELVRRHAASGVSGVVPKFLDAHKGSPSFQKHHKETLFTHRHIIKGSSERLPFAALNEHLCMQVASKIMPAARTEISRDGKALVVHRFDVDEQGQPSCGMEDFCSLLGLASSSKYETTWERIAKAVRDHVPGLNQRETFSQMARILFLTYALRNADCHAKNLALIYTSRADVRLSPVYDMQTTCIYAGYQHNPPGISFVGKNTWLPGKNLQKFVAAHFGLSLREQKELIEAVSDAVSDGIPLVQAAMNEHEPFRELGKRMLLAWGEGVAGLRDKRVYALGPWKSIEVMERISDPPKLGNPKIKIGRSENLGKR